MKNLKSRHYPDGLLPAGDFDDPRGILIVLIDVDFDALVDVHIPEPLDRLTPLSDQKPEIFPRDRERFDEVFCGTLDIFFQHCAAYLRDLSSRWLIEIHRVPTR